jgi:tetratricopeptide (TPR) repeat protein
MKFYHKSFGLIILSTFLFISGVSFSQASDGKNESNNYDIDVVKIYEKVVEDGYISPQIYELLANTQYEIRNYSEAKRWFEKWFELEKNPNKNAYLKYARTLENLNLLEKAKVYYKLYENHPN